MSWVSNKPIPLDELIVLLRPKHTAQRLPHNLLQVITYWPDDEGVVKFIGLLPSLLDGVVKDTLVLQTGVLFRPLWRELETDHSATSARRDVFEDIVSGRLRTLTLGIDKGRSLRERGARTLFLLRGRCALGTIGMWRSTTMNLGEKESGMLGIGNRRAVRRDDMIVESVLDIWHLILSSIKSGEVSVVLGEKKFWLDDVAFFGLIRRDGLAVSTDRKGRGRAIKMVSTQGGMLRYNDVAICSIH